MATRIRKNQAASLADVCTHCLSVFQRWSINFDTRKKLLNMDEQQLRDIGIDRVTAEREGSKPFWRP